VSLEHGEMELRDQHVRIVAWIAYDRDALSISLQIFFVCAHEELCGVISLVKKWIADWSVTIQTFKVELWAASVP
jgi:hypothetical protein